MVFNTFPGNENDKTSIIPAIRRLKKDYSIERVIAVADRGLNSSDNTAFLSGVNDDDSKGHDGYVYGQSVIGADKEFRQWVLDKNGYRRTKEVDDNDEEVFFIHKSRVFAKTVQLKNQAGKRNLTMQIYQKQMAYYSKKYDGYYSIVTSEKELSDKEIRDIYRGLWKIEESFKIIKSEFKSRPVHVRLDDHIEAHFLICFVTLVIMRLLESMTNHKFTVKDIRKSLINYACSYLDQNYYLFDYRDNFIKTVEKIFNLDLGKKTMTLSEIKNILKSIK